MTNIRVVSLAGVVVYSTQLPEHPEAVGAIVVHSPELRIFVFRGKQGDELLFEEVRYEAGSIAEVPWNPPSMVPGHRCLCRTPGELCHKHLTTGLWRSIVDAVSAISTSSPEIGQSELVGRVMGRLAISGVRAPDQHVRMAVEGLCRDRASRGTTDAPSVAVR